MELSKAVKYYEMNYFAHLSEIEKHFKTFNAIGELNFVIDQAARALKPNGKMDSHQRRIGKVICKRGASELTKHELEVSKAKSFEEIFKVTEIVRHKIKGLGNLWSYDTALRIGFVKKMYPKEVYVQSGVKKGVRKIFGGKLPKGRSLPVNLFPEVLQKLKPYQIENFLCIYGKDRNGFFNLS